MIQDDNEPRFTTFTIELARMIAKEASQVRMIAMLHRTKAEFTKEIGKFLGGKLTVKVEFDFSELDTRKP